MNDMNDLLAKMGHHRKVLTAANELNKKAVFDALEAAGISQILVTFHGEGDSGQIEDVAAEPAGPIPKTPITLHHTQWGLDDMTQSETTLDEAVESLCYDYLEQEHGGWENNDGAYGEFTFDVAERTMSLDFNARFTDSTNFSHTF